MKNNAFIRRRSKKDEQLLTKTIIKKKMKNALRRQERHDYESPRELERQSEAQRMVVPQSGANHVCVDTNAISKNLAY